MSDIVKFDRKTTEALDKAVEMGISAQSIQSKFERTLTLAGAMEQLQNLMTPIVIKPIMKLQNSSIGFRTDKKEGYDEATVKDCLIDATLRGLYPVGNEWNIISGKTYITKEGYGHLLNSIPGLSYTVVPGIPAMKDGGAIIEMLIRWTFNGKDNEQKLPICVRVNAGMGADAIIGKATRKARAWLHATVTGQESPDGDIQEDDIKIVKGTVENDGPSKANELFGNEAK